MYSLKPGTHYLYMWPIYMGHRAVPATNENFPCILCRDVNDVIYNVNTVYAHILMFLANNKKTVTTLIKLYECNECIWNVRSADYKTQADKRTAKIELGYILDCLLCICCVFKTYLLLFCTAMTPETARMTNTASVYQLLCRCQKESHLYVQYG